MSSAENTFGNCEVCKQQTQQKCVGCKLIYYCSQEHQKEDWRNHREKCRPYEICHSMDLGKHLIATRNLTPGDLVFTEFPLVFGPKPHIIDEGPFPCVGCCRLITQEVCEKCQDCLWPACSSVCDGLKDNQRHGLECRILKLRPFILTDSFYNYFRFDILTIIRILFLQKTNKAKWDQIMNLEDHLNLRAPGTDTFKIVDEKAAHLEEHYLKPLRAYEKESGKTILTSASRDLIHKLYGILDVNATELTEDIDAEVLYPTASLIEHNCTPNTCQIIETTDKSYRITFRAALPIQHGEHITSSYTHTLWGTHARREHLKSTKYFSCNCDRCKDPTELNTFVSALKCLVGTEQEPCGGLQLPVKPIEEKIRWVCNKCKIKLPNKEIMRFVDHLGSEVDKVLTKKPNIEELEELLEKLLKFLHPNHYHVYAVKHSLIQMYNSKILKDLSNEILKKKVEICKQLVEVTKKIDPGNARLSMYLGVILYELFDARFILLQRNFNKDNKEQFVDEVKEIAGLLKENRCVLQYDIKSTSGGKLFQCVCENGIKFQNWAKENDLENVLTA